jgi:hypothetical protein
VVANAFPTVYQAAAAGRLWGLPWEEIESQMPTIWQWWDKCERLIQAVSRHFARVGEAPGIVFATFSDPMVLDRALRYMRSSYEARDLLRSMFAALSTGDLPKAQRAVVARHCSDDS